jgi:signal peptidase I
MNSISPFERSSPSAPASASDAAVASPVDPRYKPPSAPAAEPMWRPKPIVAALLNHCAGLGHIYSGRPFLGIGALLLGILWIFGLFTMSCYIDGQAFHLAILGLAFGAPLVGLPISGYIIARRTIAAPKRWFQRWYGLLLYLLVVWATLPPLVRVLSPSLLSLYRVASSSMRPTLYPEDRVVTTLITSDLRRGDVVVTRNPLNDTLTIRRVVGLPGDTVELRNFHALVNGHEESPRVGPCATAMLTLREYWPDNLRFMADFGPVTMPDGQYALLGDCRDNAVDMRYAGFTPRADILKRVAWIYWSTGDDGKPRFDRIGKSVE